MRTMGKNKFADRRRGHPMQRLLEKYYDTRFWITLFVLGTFVLAISGIGIAIYASITLNQAWKEILLVMLGAFIGAFGRVVDFWFNNVEHDREIIQRADHEDSGVVTDKDGKTIIPTIVPVSQEETIDKS